MSQDMYLQSIYFLFSHQVILPQASEEYGPICYYYVVVVPENPDTMLMNPDEFLNQKVRLATNRIDKCMYVLL